MGGLLREGGSINSDDEINVVLEYYFLLQSSSDYHHETIIPLPYHFIHFPLSTGRGMELEALAIWCRCSNHAPSGEILSARSHPLGQ